MGGKEYGFILLIQEVQIWRGSENKEYTQYIYL